MGRQRNSKRYVPPSEKFEGIAVLARVSTCIASATGPQWEIPRFTFRLPDGREVFWNSDSDLAAWLFHEVGEGPCDVPLRIRGYVNGDRIKRVQPA